MVLSYFVLRAGRCLLDCSRGLILLILHFFDIGWLLIDLSYDRRSELSTLLSVNLARLFLRQFDLLSRLVLALLVYFGGLQLLDVV